MTSETRVQHRRLTAHMTGAKGDRPSEFIAWADDPQHSLASREVIASYNALADSHAELLAALEDLHDIYRRQVKGEDIPIGRRFDCLDRVKSAIRRARGEG